MNTMSEPYPLVTVVMPVRNEAACVAHALTAILRQAYPPDRIEIIIADGMSEDETIEIVTRVPGAERIQIISNTRQQQASGLNCAIQLARGEIIVRVDGHTVIAPDYVRRCVEALRQTGADGVGGSLNPVGKGRIGCAIAAASKSPFSVPSVYRVSVEPQNTDTVYLGAYSRLVLKRAGGYDETFACNEDYELNYRIRKSGGNIYYSPDIRSDYYGPQTVQALARQYFRYGFWKPRTLLKHPQSLRARHLAAPALVGWLIGGALFFTGSYVPLTIWSLGIFAYLVAAIICSFRATRGGRGTSALHVALVFITMHVAWGIGFWVGLAYFMTRGLNRASVS